MGALSFNWIFQELGLKKLIRKQLKKKLRRRGYSDLSFTSDLLASFLRGNRRLFGLENLCQDVNYQ